jgi:hypothetical protein
MRFAVWVGMGLLVLTAQAHAQTGATPPNGSPALSVAETREWLEAAKATAKATRENADYARVVPDILFQILTKLDKLEDKLDKVETEIKRQRTAKAR